MYLNNCKQLPVGIKWKIVIGMDNWIIKLKKNWLLISRVLIDE